jgi:hypothetical protein
MNANFEHVYAIKKTLFVGILKTFSYDNLKKYLKTGIP